MILTDSRFPFSPGSAREVRDPAAEAERLAEARKTAGMVAVPVRDLAVLVALTSVGGAHFADGDVADLPGGLTIDEAVAVLERYVTL
jgi:hypothetical protein